MSRELGKRGVEAAKKAKSELRRLDQEHEISRKAKTVARTAWNDVQSLGQKSADEIGVLISYWSRGTPAGREAQTQAQVAAWYFPSACKGSLSVNGTTVVNRALNRALKFKPLIDP